MVTADAPSLFARGLRGLTLGAVALVSLGAFEAVAVATAMPTVAAVLDGLAAYALAFGLPLATSVVGMVLAGVWSDGGGPAAPMRVGVATFVTGLLIAGLAPSMPLFAAGRAVQGLGSGMFSVALYVVVGHVVPEQAQPRTFAAFAAAWVLPAVVGPPLAGLLVQTVGWRWVFLVAVFLAAPAALLVEPTLRGLAARSHGRDPGRAVVTGGVTGERRAADAGPRARGHGVRSVLSGAAGRRVAWSSGAALGAVGLYQAGQLTGPPALLLGAGAVVLLGVAAPRLLPAGTLLGRRGLPAVIALRGLVSAAFLSAEAFLPLLLSRERGLSPALAGLVLTVAALTWSAGSWIQGRAGSRRLLLGVGTASLALGVVASAATVLPAVPVWVAMVGWAAAGLGMGLVYPVLSVLTLAHSAPGEQGANTSALQIADALFAALGLAVAGALFAALVDAGPVAYVAGFAVAAVPALLGVLTARRAAA